MPFLPKRSGPRLRNSTLVEKHNFIHKLLFKLLLTKTLDILDYLISLVTNGNNITPHLEIFRISNHNLLLLNNVT